MDWLKRLTRGLEAEESSNPPSVAPKPSLPSDPLHDLPDYDPEPADGVRVGEPNDGPVVRVGQRWLSGLLSGYHAASWIAPRKGVKIPAELMPVMDTLFPQGWPFVYQGDNY